MRLLEIDVRHWRGLSHHLVSLSPRLNLILGPNESGKSRLFQAIRFGLFESYKGAAQHKQLLQSWSSLESPFVRLVFSDGDIEYELQKQFLKGASVQLAGDGATLRNEEAEEMLRKIIGARPGGNRGIDSANLGIWPLLMVSQGESRKAIQDDLNDDGRSRLQEKLSKEIGVAAISATGQRLMALAEQEYSRFFTATGQDNKALRDARAELEAADAAFTAAGEALRRQEQTAATLADNRQELSGLETRFRNAQQEANAARVQAEAVQVAAARVSIVQGELNTATERAASIEAALNTRVEADQVVERLTGELTTLETALGERATLQEELDQTLQVAEAQVGKADEKLRKTRDVVDALRRERRRIELTSSQEELGNRIASLERLEKAMTEARSQRAALPLIDAAGLDRLKTLDQAVQRAAAQLQGAAVSVVIYARQKIAIDGTPHDSGERVQVDVIENRRISIGEFADVEVRPGGGALEKLRESKTAAENAFAAQLGTLGATDLDDATRIHTDLADLDRQSGVLSAQIKATSPKSLTQLREDLARITAELERLGPAAQIDGDEASVNTKLSSAETALTEARGARDRARAALEEFRLETAGLTARAAAARDERDRIVRTYSQRPTADTLRETQAQAITERERAQVSLIAAQREFSDLGGTEVQNDARRLTQAAESLANRLQNLRSTVDQLQGTLQQMITAGNYETVQQADAYREHTSVNLARLERQAAAAKLLWQVLNEERRRVVERLTAPVTQRIKPYLQDLFPGSTLDAGEGLNVVGLQSGNLKEPFMELSGGAQEQISLLTRIGIAEVLAGEGTLPLILDDALINTDPERIQRVHRALFRAAEKLQIILFSCHDILFDGLGAEFIVKLEKVRHGQRAS